MEKVMNVDIKQVIKINDSEKKSKVKHKKGGKKKKEEKKIFKKILGS